MSVSHPDSKYKCLPLSIVLQMNDVIHGKLSQQCLTLSKLSTGNEVVAAAVLCARRYNGKWSPHQSSSVLPSNGP